MEELILDTDEIPSPLIVFLMLICYLTIVNFNLGSILLDSKIWVCDDDNDYTLINYSPIKRGL